MGRAARSFKRGSVSVSVVCSAAYPTVNLIVGMVPSISIPNSFTKVFSNCVHSSMYREAWWDVSLLGVILKMRWSFMALRISVDIFRDLH